MVKNDYTRELLNYSAERDDCIARPQRWNAPAPLVVDTPLFDEMGDLADELWGTKNPVWYFLVGGPGNGKSEAVARFVRRINQRAIQDGLPPVFDPSRGKDGGAISYLYEGRAPLADVAILQDVSVPRSLGSNPALDLLATLEQCASTGSHLLVCANRGMLLRAAREARASARTWLVDLLDWIDSQSQDSALASDSRHAVEQGGNKIQIRAWPIDHESVLFGQVTANPWANAEGSLVDQIVLKAVSEENWEIRACSGCTAKGLCPMLGDARWLRNKERRESFLRILRHAEIASGQHIVLREALGLISTVLVGTPSDFVEAGVEAHPCEWVQKRISPALGSPKDDRALVELISHRIYQDLFGRASPTGLLLSRASNRRDAILLDRLNGMGFRGSVVADAASAVDRAFPKQAGPVRLVGDGLLQIFDPSRDNSWCFKRSLVPDGVIADLRKLGALHQEDLEKHLADIFQVLEDQGVNLEAYRDPAKVLAAIYRWASTIFLRLAGTALGDTPNSASLGDYLALLEDPLQPIGTPAKQSNLRDLMKSATGNDLRYELAPRFTAEVPALQVKPIGARKRSVSPRWPANDRLTLQVTALGMQGPVVILNAGAFVDMWRKTILGVADWNISPAMENLMRSWREDSVVSQGQYRGVDVVEFREKQALQFEFAGAVTQVRSK